MLKLKINFELKEKLFHFFNALKHSKIFILTNIELDIPNLWRNKVSESRINKVVRI